MLSVCRAMLASAGLSCRVVRCAVCDESELRCECLAEIYAALLIRPGVIAAVMVVG